MVQTTSFSAFGGVATVAVRAGQNLPAVLAAVHETVAEFDLACSRFREDSELSAVNRRAGRPVVVGDALLEAVEASLGAAELTDGAVDPTVGGALMALGYDRDLDEVRSRPQAAAIRAASVPGWRRVELDRSRGTVAVPRGCVLDLGATAKALAADHAAARACEAAGVGVLVSFSGDLAIAGAPPEDGWLVRVTDDHRAAPGAPGQSIVLRDGGLATSSTAVRRWSTASGELHHVIDPATGRPTGGPWRTVSVAAASCLGANIASTAALVHGDSATATLERMGLPARLVSLQGTVTHLGGWPSADEDLAA